MDNTDSQRNTSFSWKCQQTPDLSLLEWKVQWDEVGPSGSALDPAMGEQRHHGWNPLFHSPIIPHKPPIMCASILRKPTNWNTELLKTREWIPFNLLYKSPLQLDNSLFTLYTAGRRGSGETWIWHTGAPDGMAAEPTLPFLGSTSWTLSLSSLCTSAPPTCKRPELNSHSWNLSGSPKSPPTPRVWFCWTLPIPSADHPPFPMKSHPKYLMSTYWLTDQLEQTVRM